MCPYFMAYFDFETPIFDLLDSGSELNIISSYLASSFPSKKNIDLSFHTVATTQNVSEMHECSIYRNGFHLHFDAVHISTASSHLDPKPSQIPSHVFSAANDLLDKWNSFPSIPFVLDENVTVDLILSVTSFTKIIKENIAHLGNDFLLLDTHFGSIIMGGSTSLFSDLNTILNMTVPALNNQKPTDRSQVAKSTFFLNSHISHESLAPISSGDPTPAIKIGSHIKNHVHDFFPNVEQWAQIYYSENYGVGQSEELVTKHVDAISQMDKHTKRLKNGKYEVPFLWKFHKPN